MTIWKFKNWCDAAVDGIIFPPDRAQVHKELLNHIYDHYDDLVEQGLDEETARTLALSAMGDAKEIAPQLAAIHRPFWGYLLRVTRIVLVLLLCITAVYGSVQLLRTHYSDPSDSAGLNPFEENLAYRDFGTMERVFFAKPYQSVHSDGYTITLTKAAIWYADYADDDPYGEDNYNFYCQMRVFNPRPWAEFTDIHLQIRAVDSLGNHYDSYYNGLINYAPYISGNQYHTGPQTYTYELFINGFRSEDAEWIEFHYDRSGRDLTWRLDLTGGDAA